MAKEYDIADFEALPVADGAAEGKQVEACGDIGSTAANLPRFLRRPANRLAFQTWLKDSYCYRAACKWADDNRRVDQPAGHP